MNLFVSNIFVLFEHEQFMAILSIVFSMYAVNLLTGQWIKTWLDTAHSCRVARELQLEG